MRSIAETDLGTPKSPSTETVALTIDGVDVRVPAGTSVMRAASESASRFRSCARPNCSMRSARAACAWCRSKA